MGRVRNPDLIAMDSYHVQFLELLRAGLWGKAADPGLFCAEVDWDAIIGTAMDQTVTLLVADGYATLPQQMQAPKRLQFKVEAYRLKTSQAHLILNQSLAQLSRLLDDKGIHHVLFKGQGLAKNYTNPLARACGDIDLYVGDKNLERAKAILDSFGVKDGEDSKSDKHIHCKRNGVDFELHRIAETLDRPSKNRLYQKWTLGHLSECGEFEFLETDGQRVKLPTAQFNVLYVFNHMYHHFLNGGVGLRQLCDWVRLLHTHAGQYDWEILERDLNAFGLSSAWKVFGQLAVEYLGLPAEEMPLYCKPQDKRAHKALEAIFYFGNFGKKSRLSQSPRPKGYYAGKLHSFFYNVRASFRLFFIFPCETLTHFVKYTIYGTVIALKRSN